MSLQPSIQRMRNKVFDDPKIKNTLSKTSKKLENMIQKLSKSIFQRTQFLKTRIKTN